MTEDFGNGGGVRRRLAILAVVGLLAACGGADDPASPDTGDNADPGNADAATETQEQATSGGADTAPDDADAEPISVRYVIGLSPLPSASAYYSSLPDVLGYFEDEGLDVDMQLVDGGNSAVQTMVAGRADVTLTASNAVLAAINQGMEAKSFCSLLTSTHILPAVVADSEIESIEGFEGQVVGVPAVANAATTLIRGLLADVGLDPDTDVSIVPIGTGAEAVTAIERGNAEAFSMVDSHYASLENEGIEFRYLTTPLLDELTYNQVLTMSDEFAQAHPDVGARFGRAVAKATLFAQRYPERSIELHWERYPETRPTGMELDEAVERDLHVFNTRVQKTEIPEGQQWCQATDESVQRTVDFLVSQEQLDEPLPVSDYWTSDYIEEINNFDESTVQESSAG